MSDLAREVAEKVMGWQWKDATSSIEPGFGRLPAIGAHWKTPDGKTYYDFHPHANMMDAWLVVEKMRERCWAMQMNSDGDGWHVTFIKSQPAVWEERDGKRWYTAVQPLEGYRYAQSVAEAISHAALAAVRGRAAMSDKEWIHESNMSQRQTIAKLTADLAEQREEYGKTITWAGTLAEEIIRLRALLAEVRSSGVELDDARMRYLVVQIDRELWERLR